MLNFYILIFLGDIDYKMLIIKFFFHFFLEDEDYEAGKIILMLNRLKIYEIFLLLY